MEPREQTREVIERCLRAIAARGIPATAAEISRRTGVDDGQVRKVLNLGRHNSPRQTLALLDVSVCADPVARRTESIIATQKQRTGISVEVVCRSFE